MGKTPCYIAKRYGCRVFGVDISESMIERSSERVKRDGIEDKVNLIVAGARNLPFKDIVFDAVICESVTAFPKDKKRAVNEYVRVVKQRGYVGINEAIWIKAKPPAELAEYFSRVTGAEILTPDGWKGLLENSGLRNIEVRVYRSKSINESINQIKWMVLKNF